MMKQFCDHCGADVTDVPSGHVSGIEEANERGDGLITHGADLCVSCYEEFLTWSQAHVAVSQDGLRYARRVTKRVKHSATRQQRKRR